MSLSELRTSNKDKVNIVDQSSIHKLTLVTCQNSCVERIFHNFKVHLREHTHCLNTDIGEFLGFASYILLYFYLIILRTYKFKKY